MNLSKGNYADAVRTIATIAVVVIHSSGEIVNNFNHTDWNNWWICNFFNSATRWSVPLFVMLSGSLLLSPTKAEPNSSFFKKRISRVFVPYVFWSVFYFIYTYRDPIYDGTSLPWFDIRNKLMTTDMYFHLWFISMILGLYLLTPFFRVYLKAATKQDQEYFILLWFVLVSINSYHPKFFIIKFLGWMGYCGMYVLGYYLKEYGLPYRKLFYPFAWVCFLSTAPLTYYYSAQYGVFNGAVYLYLAPTTIIYSAALFDWFLRRDWAGFAERRPSLWKMIQYFAGISFGVYLLHAYVLDCLKNGYFGFRLYNDNLLGYQIPSIVAVPIVVLTVLVICSVVVGIAHRVRFLKRLVG